MEKRVAVVEKEFIRFAERLADFVHKKKISVVVLPGSSARTAWIFLSEALKHRYPRDPLPKVYSLGKSIHKIMGVPSEDNFSFEKLDLYKNFLRETRPGIFSHFDKPVLIFDEEIYNGSTISNSKELFRKLGFKKIFAGGLQGNRDFKGLDIRLPKSFLVVVQSFRGSILKFHKSKDYAVRDSLRNELRQEHKIVRNLAKNVKPKRILRF